MESILIQEVLLLILYFSLQFLLNYLYFVCGLDYEYATNIYVLALYIEILVFISSNELVSSGFSLLKIISFFIFMVLFFSCLITLACS